MAIPLEQPIDRKPLRLKSDIWLGVLLGAWGFFSIYRGAVLYFDPSSSHTARALPMGVLLLLVAAQCFTGASRDARLWLVAGLFLIPGADVALESARVLRETSGWNADLWAAAPALLALLALWSAVRRGRSGGERP